MAVSLYGYSVIAVGVAGKATDMELYASKEDAEYTEKLSVLC
jgi:hypothetical protein